METKFVYIDFINGRCTIAYTIAETLNYVLQFVTPFNKQKDDGLLKSINSIVSIHNFLNDYDLIDLSSVFSTNLDVSDIIVFMGKNKKDNSIKQFQYACYIIAYGNKIEEINE